MNSNEEEWSRRTGREEANKKNGTQKSFVKKKKKSQKRPRAAKSGVDAELHTGLQAQVQSAEGPCHSIIFIWPSHEFDQSKHSVFPPITTLLSFPTLRPASLGRGCGGEERPPLVALLIAGQMPPQILELVNLCARKRAKEKKRRKRSFAPPP